MSVRQHLESQLSEVKIFCSLLEQERSIYIGEQIDATAVADITAKKQQSLDRIADLENKRQHGQAKLGFPEGMEGAVALAKSAKCLDIWHQIIEESLRSQQLNSINGNLIQMAARQNQAILDFLQNASGGVLYGKDGGTKQKSLGGIKAKA